MVSNPRRKFLKFAAGSLGATAAASMMPAVIRDALATPASNTTGTLNDVQHIIVFMQENRAFDHYYGTLRGVRGFNDRMTITLPNGDPVWKQPTSNGGYILPFHVDTSTTSATCEEAATMDYPTDIAMWNNGLYNAWNTARSPVLGMSYYTRADLPFYYSLADAFTICDQYHCSTLTQTNPNRLHLFSGSNGLSVGQAPTLDNTEPTPGFSWPTVAETLEAANISWKVYQQSDNFDDNGFAWFQSFKTAPTTSPLYQKGIAVVNDLAQALAADVAAGTLPQVSWIVAPAALSEHPDYHPAAGEDLTARLLTALVSNPDVWSKTVFLLNYDEQGGFFDHDPPPTPPASAAQATMSTTGELYAGKPIGLGFRVPMMMISPWSKGGYVCSQVFDHTSVIQFIEQRFGVHCPNISPWRRAICGDLTSAFNFKNPDDVWPKAALPDTSNYVAQANQQCSTLPYPTVPTIQSMPRQEPGTRPSRALPYEFHASARVDPASSTFWLIVANGGNVGAAFSAYDLATPINAPRRYAVDAGAQLSDNWSGTALTGTKYGIALHGANGFLRAFAGDVAATAGVNAANPEIRVCYDVANSAVYLTLMNSGQGPCTFTVTSNAYRTDGPWTFTVAAGGAADTNWPVSASANWYDFSVTVAAQPAFLRRFAGRLESGSDLTSDPAAA